MRKNPVHHGAGGHLGLSVIIVFEKLNFLF